jgi:hypothetical protein
MIPEYLRIFRQAVRKLEDCEKSEISEISTPLISHNSLISHPPVSENTVATEIKTDLRGQRDEANSRGANREKSELSEKRVEAEVFPYASALSALGPAARITSPSTAGNSA